MSSSAIVPKKGATDGRSPLIKEDSTLKLPEEVLVYMFSFCSLQSLVASQFVCRRWKFITTDPSLWRGLASLAGIVNLNNDATWRESVIKCQTFLLCKGGLMPMKKTIFSPWGGISCSALSNNQLVIGIFDREKSLKLASLDTHPVRPTPLTGERKQSTAVLFSSPFIWTGDTSGVISVWDVRREINKCSSFQGHRYGITSLAQQGEYLLSGSIDRAVSLWDIRTNFRLFSYLEHEDQVNSVIFAGSFYISGSEDQTIRIFNSRSRILIEKINIGHPVRGISSYGTTFVSSSNQKMVHCWDTRQLKKPLRIIDTNNFLYVSAIAMHGYAYLIAGMNSKNKSVIQIRSTVSDQVALTLHTKEEGPAGQFHIGADRLISAHRNAVISWKFSNPKLQIQRKASPNIFNDTINQWS